MNGRLYPPQCLVGAAQTQHWPPLHISSLLGKRWPGPLIPEARPARHKLLPCALEAELAHTLCLPCSLAGGTFSFCRRSRLAGPPLGSSRSCFRLPPGVFWGWKCCLIAWQAHSFCLGSSLWLQCQVRSRSYRNKHIAIFQTWIINLNIRGRAKLETNRQAFTGGSPAVLPVSGLSSVPSRSLLFPEVTSQHNTGPSPQAARGTGSRPD